MELVPTTKQIKSSSIQAAELLAGICGAHAISTQIKSDKKFINPLAALASLYAHCTVKNQHAKDLLLGAVGYFGLKSMGQLKTAAVEGLEGIEGMDGFRDVLNKIVPSLGEAEVEILSGSELAAAEAELLGLMGEGEFTPYTEVAPKQVGTVSLL